MVYYIGMRRFHIQNVSYNIWWVKFTPEWSSSQFKVSLIFAFFPVFWFDFYVKIKWCKRDTRASTFFPGCLPGLMLCWFTPVFKEVNMPRYLQVLLKDFDLSQSHTPETKLPNLRTNHLNWLRVYKRISAFLGLVSYLVASKGIPMKNSTEYYHN